MEWRIRLQTLLPQSALITLLLKHYRVRATPKNLKGPCRLIGASISPFHGHGGSSLSLKFPSWGSASSHWDMAIFKRCGISVITI